VNDKKDKIKGSFTTLGRLSRDMNYHESIDDHLDEFLDDRLYFPTDLKEILTEYLSSSSELDDVISGLNSYRDKFKNINNKIPTLANITDYLKRAQNSPNLLFDPKINDVFSPLIIRTITTRSIASISKSIDQRSLISDNWIGHLLISSLFFRNDSESIAYLPCHYDLYQNNIKNFLDHLEYMDKYVLCNPRLLANCGVISPHFFLDRFVKEYSRRWLCFSIFNLLDSSSLDFSEWHILTLIIIEKLELDSGLNSDKCSSLKDKYKSIRDTHIINYKRLNSVWT
jgi:hypothetical protein